MVTQMKQRLVLPASQADARAPGGHRASLASGQALTLGRGAGELSVLDGRVWVTRKDDLGDHVLEAGRSIRFGANAGLVIEAWDQAATVQWQRLAQPLRLPAFVVGGLAAGLRGLATGAGAAAAALRGAEGGLADLARKAAASARRAQFCISGGDSMASSGALK